MAGYTLRDSAGNAIVVGDEIVANPTLYVDDTNGNDANAGASAGSGNALKTIQAAIDKLPKTIKGTGTINIAAGTYREQVTIEKFTGGILLLDGAGATTIISGADSGSATTAARDYCIKSTNNAFGKLHLKDMRLEYPVQAGFSSELDGGNNLLENVEIQNTGTASSGVGDGVRLTNTCRTVAINVDIENCVRHAWMLSQSRLDFETVLSTTSNTGKDAANSGFPIWANNSKITVSVDDCSFGTATAQSGYCFMLSGSHFQHGGTTSSIALTMVAASGGSYSTVGVRGRWCSIFAGKGTVTETNIDTSTNVTTGSVRENGS